MDRTRCTPVAAPGPSRSAPPDEALALMLPALRAALERQLRFRREQLARLGERDEAAGPESGAEPPDSRTQEATRALREVDALVAAGARRAVDDISMALDRMRAGRYGHCRSCGDHIPLAVLAAIPKTTLCLACQIRRDHRW